MVMNSQSQSPNANEEDILQQIFCCPVTVAPNPNPDADAKQLPHSTTPLSLERVASNTSNGNISLGRKPSCVSVAEPEQTSIDEQVGTGGADADAGQVIEVPKSRSVLSSLFRESSRAADEQSVTGGIDSDEGQVVLDVQKSRSGASIEPSRSRSALSQNVLEKSGSGSFASVQGLNHNHDIHAHAGEAGDSNGTAVPYGHGHGNYEERTCRSRRNGRFKSAGVAVAALSVVVGLSAALSIALSLTRKQESLEIVKKPPKANCTATITKSPKANSNCTAIPKSPKSSKARNLTAIVDLEDEDEDVMLLPPAQYLIAPGPELQPEPEPEPLSPLHRLLSSLGLMPSTSDEVEVEKIGVEVEEVAFELEGVATKCDPGTLSYLDATWLHYDELIKKNRKIATLARNIKEYAPKQGIVEDIIEQQDSDDRAGEDADIKNVDQHFIPHHLIFTHKKNLLDCEVSSSEPSLHTMAHNVRDIIKTYRTVWGDDMEYSFLTDVECRDAIYEVEPELLVYYDGLQGMFKGDVCRSAILYLKGG